MQSILPKRCRGSDNCSATPIVMIEVLHGSECHITGAFCFAVTVSVAGVFVERSGGHAVLLRDALKDIYSDDLRADRSHLYQIADKPYEGWDQADYAAANRVAIFFDRMGFLIRARYVPRRHFIDKWGDVTARCYKVCRPMILGRRDSEGVAHHFVHFEWLARTSVATRRRAPWWRSASLEHLRSDTADRLESIPIPRGQDRFH